MKNKFKKGDIIKPIAKRASSKYYNGDCNLNYPMF